MDDVFDPFQTDDSAIRALTHGLKIICELHVRFSKFIAVSNNLDTGRARHSVRAVVCLAKFGAHGVTRPTMAMGAKVNMIRHISKCAFMQKPRPCDARTGLMKLDQPKPN